MNKGEKDRQLKRERDEAAADVAQVRTKSVAGRVGEERGAFGVETKRGEVHDGRRS